MPKEYRTIQEVAGPLMLVRGVEGVSYNELGEIELADGEKRRCKVLEIDDGNALVQLFEASTGINLESSKVRFLGRSMELGVSEDILSRVFDGLGRPRTADIFLVIISAMPPKKTIRMNMTWTTDIVLAPLFQYFGFWVNHTRPGKCSGHYRILSSNMPEPAWETFYPILRICLCHNYIFPL